MWPRPAPVRPSSGDQGASFPHPALRTLSVGITASDARADSQEHVILRELEQILSHHGHSTVFLNRAHSLSHPRALGEAIRDLLRGGVDALVVVCLDIDRAQIAEEISRIELGAVPAVCVLAGELNLSIPHVFYDNRGGGFQAVRHLFERGWTDITVLAPFTASWVSERIAGVRDAATYLPSSSGRVQVLAGEGREWSFSEDPRAIGRQAAEAALASGWQPAGGVVCINDGVAFGLLDALAGRGLEAGRNFGLIGFDDDSYARTVGLTSLRPPMQGMAREAARLLLDQVQGADVGLQVRLRAHVIPRASTTMRSAASQSNTL